MRAGGAGLRSDHRSSLKRCSCLSLCSPVIFLWRGSYDQLLPASASGHKHDLSSGSRMVRACLPCLLPCAYLICKKAAPRAGLSLMKVESHSTQIRAARGYENTFRTICEKKCSNKSKCHTQHGYLELKVLRETTMIPGRLHSV